MSEHLKRIVNRSAEAGGRIPQKVSQRRIDLERALIDARAELAKVQGEDMAARNLRNEIGAFIIRLGRDLETEKKRIGVGG